MELAVLWVVLIAIGAFVLGLIGGWFASRRARTAAGAASPSLVKPAGSPSAGTTTAERISQPAMSAAASPTAAASDETVSSDAEVNGHRLAGGEAPLDEGTSGDATERPAGADMAATARLERDERARYAEIIGIETENASLRAVAARVPGLERRIRELEAAIEEHTGHDQVIDLAGPTLPVAGPDSADATPR